MTDILLDENMDVQVKDGDFVLGESLEQNQKVIIMAEKGEIKSSPLLGVGVNSFLDDDEPDELLREIRKNLRADGQKVSYCGLVNGEIIVKVK